MKKVLIVVDYQKDFVDGTLGFKKAETLEPIICQKIEQYKNSGDDIIFTFDTHPIQYLETREGKHLPIPHCIQDTDGWNLYGKVASYFHHDSKFFIKGCFGSLSLANYLKDKSYDTVELCGVVSNICVLSNAVLAQAALPEAEIVIDAAATASSSQELHEKTLDVMSGLQMTVLNR
jgi:nicotinamidase/pyrazinamidase